MDERTNKMLNGFIDFCSAFWNMGDEEIERTKKDFGLCAPDESGNDDGKTARRIEQR
jgi:hypothetical protein